MKISLGGTTCTDTLKDLLESLPRSHIYDITADCTVKTWFKPDPVTAATNSITTSPCANAPASNPLTRSQGAGEDHGADITTSRPIASQTTETSSHTDTGNNLVRGPYIATTRTFQTGRNDEVHCTERSDQNHNKTNGIFGGGPSEDKNTERPRNTRHSVFSSTPITSMTSTEPRMTKKAKYSSLHGHPTEKDWRVIPKNGMESSAQDRQPIVSSNENYPRSDSYLNISDETTDTRTRSPASHAREFESSSSFQSGRQKNRDISSRAGEVYPASVPAQNIRTERAFKRIKRFSIP